jgi:arsenate reductase-like glutaredoxin family protein
MSTDHAELIKMLKAMSKDIEQIKENVAILAQSDARAEDMYKILNAKLDFFKNLNLESRENISDTQSEKKLTKPSLFKKLFLENREKYIDILYTQAEIDAIYASEDVIKKKKDSDKATKVASDIYTKHIKANFPEGRASAFESIYSQVYP